MPRPTPANIISYLSASGLPARTVEDVTSALDAEAAAQAHKCRVPADDAAWPPDLTEALFRRVARNLAMRPLPLGLSSTITEGAAVTVRIGSDPEVRRLEAPYTKVVMG